MNDDSDDDKCNCADCYKQPNRAFRVKEGKKEPANVSKNEFSGMKRGFFNPPKKEEAAANKHEPETAPSTTASIPTASKETAHSKQKPIANSMPETIECEKVVHPEIKQEEEKIELRCTKCTESNDTIDVQNQGTFKVTCTDGCVVTLHRNCFEKALGSAKKKELKTCICPTDDCGCSVLEIAHRIPGSNDYVLWLRCEVKESERPKKEEKGKEVKKKEEKKEKDKFKKDRREEYEGRRFGMEENGTPSTQSNPPSTCPPEETPLISLALPVKPREEEAKKNLAKPLPADLEARPIERKEDAVMSKYAVKESNTKEMRKKQKKEVRQVVLPGLTVKGQRGKKEEEDPWNVNEAPPQMEEMEGNSTNGDELIVENNSDTRYEDGPYGFAMPEEVPHQFVDGDWIRGGMEDSMTPARNMNNPHNPFHHPLPFGNGGIFRPTLMNESAFAAQSSSQPLYEHNGHDSLSGFTESPSMEEPPLIENPFDYPTLERESVRERKELVNFFETHTPVLEENAALFDSPQIDLDQLMSMLENFIEFQFYGNEEEKRNMTETLHSIFTGDVENDIIPFLIDLQCFKYGYVDGRLVVSVKTEGIQRREREETIRREREEREEEERRREAKKQEEVKKAVMALEKRRLKEVEERELIRLEEERLAGEQRRKEEQEREAIRMEEERRARDQRRKEEEDRRKREAEQRRREEAEERERKAAEEKKKREMEELKRKEEKEKRELEIEKERKRIIEKQRLEEKRKEEEKERKMMEEEEERRRNEAMSSKNGNEKKTKQMELERKTREAINTLRIHTQSKGSSSESSPERKQLLKCSRSTGSSSSLAPPPSSSSAIAFSTSAPPFIPRFSALSANSKAELNPDAPAFVPTQSAEVSILVDENGKEVNDMWIETNKLKHEMNVNTIEELNRRIAKLEAEKKEMEDKNRMREMEMMKKDGTRMNENKMNQEKIAQLNSRVEDISHQIVWKDQKISQITLESEKKSDELKSIKFDFGSKMEEMQSRIRTERLNVMSEKREKESVMEMREREEEEKKRVMLERKTGCAKDAILMCTHIINKLATDHEAQVMTSIFIDLRKKWMDHFSILKHSLDADKLGEAIDWKTILSLEEPSMPRETDDLVQECYVWHYQTMHILSFRLASIVKKCLNDHKRYYEDAFIIGIIQKWMRIYKDPTKIEATVPQVANMVAQAMGDAPLMPPRYVHVSARPPPTPPTPPAPPTPTRMPTLHTERTTTSHLRGPVGKNEPKGWKKASDKLRHVDMQDHECSICLEDTEGGDISYCEQVSCNEPYHNDCLDQYWKTGGRNCPRCRTPMPPRDAFPALG